jgi:hypothetical protein
MTLFPREKRYTQYRIDASAGEPPASVSAAMTFSDMGKTDTVAGYLCSMYTVSSRAVPGRTEICASPAVSALVGAPETYKYLTDGFDAKGFELRVTVYDGDGKIVATKVVERIETRPEPADLFRVPAGYTLFSTSPTPKLPRPRAKASR